MENLKGGAEKDLFTMKMGASLSGQIDGGSGTNAIDYQSYTTDVYVNLLTGKAPGVAGGIKYVNQAIGGAGNDILVGNSSLVGNRLYGMGGRDILIGGLGADVLKGGDGDDILIAGSTVYDSDPVALFSLMNRWKSTRSPYSSRLTSIINGQFKLTAATAPNDTFADELSGELGQDWFWGSLAEIEDKASNESVGAP